jgi:hypothetical protein
MAHYALLNNDNIVVKIITGKDENDSNTNWEEYYSNKLNFRCKRTSYNTIGGSHKNGGIAFRKNYAGIGFSYDESRDAFIPPKPYASWILDENSCLWKAPIPKPESQDFYYWDENNQKWINPKI